MKGKRKLQEVLEGRLREPAPLIQVITGPRQVGKTTAVQAVVGRSAPSYMSADGPVPPTAQDLSELWQAARQAGVPALAVDEVQKIPDWSEIIKSLWDREQAAGGGLRVVLTGSSSLQLQKGLTESLAGRYELIQAEHWHFDEAHSAFAIEVDDYIRWGCYPGAQRFAEDRRRWGQYVRDAIIEPVLGRDLLQLHPVEQPALLRQIFAAAASLPAQLVSLQKLQGQLQGAGNLQTIQRYLDLLRHAFLVTGVEKYSVKQHRTRRSTPKLVIHDNALLAAVRRPVEAELGPDEVGRYFENAVGARLLEAGWDVYYWKHRNLEVDYVALGPDGERLAIEVKAAGTTPKALAGLEAFCREYTRFEPRLVSQIDQEIAGVPTWPVQEVLSLHRAYG